MQRKGITFNYDNSKVINFTTLRDKILKDTAPVQLYNRKEIKTKQSGVVSEPEIKVYKFDLSSTGLCTTLTLYRMRLNNLIYSRLTSNSFIHLFILFGKRAINRGAIAHFSSV